MWRLNQRKHAACRALLKCLEQLEDVEEALLCREQDYRTSHSTSEYVLCYCLQGPAQVLGAAGGC
jgi:hypothetical protein